MFLFGLGNLIYTALLITNAMAILSEDRFLARIGWSSSQVPNGAPNFHQPYDQTGYGNPQAVDIGVKGRMINLIGAVRTLMRIPLIGLNILVILYELVRI